MVCWGRHGDRTGERRRHVALPAIIGGLAIPVALSLDNPLPSAFLSEAAAAGGVALVNSLGNVSGFAAPYLTGRLADLTGTQRAGLWVVGASMVLAGLGVFALRAGSDGRDPTGSTDSAPSYPSAANCPQAAAIS